MIGNSAECTYVEEENNPAAQCDQIGRIFAHWVIVYFGQLFLNCRSSPLFAVYFYHR
jgi:hypothetical protein